MILIIIAALLFLLVGKTGKFVRAGLQIIVCQFIIYFGIPAFAVFMLWLRHQ